MNLSFDPQYKVAMTGCVSKHNRAQGAAGLRGFRCLCQAKTGKVLETI